MATPAWVRQFYDQKTTWFEPFAPPPIFDHDRERAAAVERMSGAGQKRILELGAGEGGTAAATAALGHTVVALEVSPIRVAYARRLAATCP